MIPEAARKKDAAAIKQLLAACDLPHVDIAAANLGHFWVLRDDEGLVGVVGLEMANDGALLRSLAVVSRERARGCGGRLLRHAEAHARSQGVRDLYLLTETAEDFFTHRGYRRTERAGVPPAISATAEFRELCPESAVCLIKHITTSRRRV